MVGFSKLGTEQIGISRMTFFMIKIYDEVHVYELPAICSLTWKNCSEREESNFKNSQLNFRSAISGLTLQV